MNNWLRAFSTKLDQAVEAAYLGCKRLKDAYSDCRESVLTAASRLENLIKRGEEIRNAE